MSAWRWRIGLGANVPRLQFLPQSALSEVSGLARAEWLADRQAELLSVPVSRRLHHAGADKTAEAAKKPHRDPENPAMSARQWAFSRLSIRSKAKKLELQASVLSPTNRLKALDRL
jgi:hypothetical protein